MNRVSFRCNIYYDFLLLFTEIPPKKRTIDVLGALPFKNLKKYGEGIGKK